MGCKACPAVGRGVRGQVRVHDRIIRVNGVQVRGAGLLKWLIFERCSGFSWFLYMSIGLLRNTLRTKDQIVCFFWGGGIWSNSRKDPRRHQGWKDNVCRPFCSYCQDLWSYCKNPMDTMCCCLRIMGSLVFQLPLGGSHEHRLYLQCAPVSLIQNSSLAWPKHPPLSIFLVVQDRAAMAILHFFKPS